MVYWSLRPAGGLTDRRLGRWPTADADAADFMISSDGVLSFKFSPDYEMPRGRRQALTTPTRWWWWPRRRASALPRRRGPVRKKGYKKVTVNGHQRGGDRDGDPVGAVQAQVGVQLTATYNDLDNEKPADTGLTWKWYLGNSPIPGAGGMRAASRTYTPDGSGSLTGRGQLHQDRWQCKKHRRRSVSGRCLTLITPPLSSRRGSEARSVDENSPPGTKVGKPVTAIDPGDNIDLHAVRDDPRR